jgi:hypothetical protein
MNMRFLRGLGGRSLVCGCLVGIYETYSGRVVAAIDWRGPECHAPQHVLHATLPAWEDPQDDVATEPVRLSRPGS